MRLPALLSAVLLAGCSTVLGLGDYTEDDGMGGGGGPGGTVSRGGTGGTGAAMGGNTAGGEGGADPCAPQTTCGGECVDTDDDADNCGRCDHVCASDRCEDGLCEPVLLATEPDGVTNLASDGTHVYWATGGGSPLLHRVTVTGGMAETLSPIGLATLFGLGPDHVYWVDTNQNFRRVPKTGGTSAIFLPSAELPADFSVVGGRLWALRNPMAAEGVWQADEVGTPEWDSHALVANGAALVLDDNWIYVLVRQSAFDYIRRIARTGAPPAEFEFTDQQDDRVDGVSSIAVDASSFFWAHLTQGIFSKATQGGDTPVVEVLAGAIKSIAIDQDMAGWIYFHDPNRTQIMRVAKGGGAPEAIADANVSGDKIFASSEHVVWSDGNDILMTTVPQ